MSTEVQPSTQQKSTTTAVQSRFLKFIFWTPPWCRLQDSIPPKLTLRLNILYAFSAGFNSASLYYSHPILNVLANAFDTTQAGVANIPTLAQAGEATCLLLILPLADFFPRRKFVLLMTSLATLFWLGLCLTSNITIFLVLTYMSALFTCVVHIVIPLVSELSPPSKRAFNLSIVGTGPTLGILLARILSGVVANYTSWRDVYWMGFSIQVCVLLALFLSMPDYPASNNLSVREVLTQYPNILWSIVKLYWKHPVLVQACLLAFCSFMVLTSFWTTLTFLLTAPPYKYSSAAVGIFGLIGAMTLVLGPVFGKYVIAPLGKPLFAVLLGTTISFTGVVVGTYVGTHSVAGPVIEAMLLDAGLIVVFIANRLSIGSIEPKAMNRVTTAFMSVMHLGQLAGTKAGNQVYQRYGGWVASGNLSIGMTVAGYLIVVLRGPNEKGWLGWKGGWGRGADACDGIEGDVEMVRENLEEK